MLRQSSFWDNSYKKAAGSALKKVIRYVTIIGYPFVCSFAGDDIIELDSTTDEIKMPPFRMASFLSPLFSASRFNLLAQTRKRAHHQVDVFVFKFLNDVQIGFLRSGHTRMSKTPGNACDGNARKQQ